MSDVFADQVTGVGALAEPVRRALYLYVAGQPDAVSREQAAEGCEVALHSAKFHLDRLVDEGLLEVEFRRLSGRSGPGAGRPSKLYRRSDRQITVSLPERRYDLAGEILASAIERATRDGVPLDEAITGAAEVEGRRIAASASGGTSGRSKRARGSVEGQAALVADVLAGHGYEPRTTDAGVCLENCPFDVLARDHTDLVCTMNLSLIEAMLDELGCTGLEAVLAPKPDLCCVEARLRGSATPTA